MRKLVLKKFYSNVKELTNKGAERKRRFKLAKGKTGVEPT
jgi:hypothetical protein